MNAAKIVKNYTVFSQQVVLLVDNSGESSQNGEKSLCIFRGCLLPRLFVSVFSDRTTHKFSPWTHLIGIKADLCLDWDHCTMATYRTKQATKSHLALNLPEWEIMEYPGNF